jgi:hypothetical protein
MTARAVDIIGFIALGLFTAHITGNLVILAAHYVTGRFGEIGPILKEGALKLGFVSEAEFDRVVDPAKMTHPYLAKAG